MATDMTGLFGPTPEELQQQRMTGLRQNAMEYAKMDPFQQATAGIYQGAGMLTDVGARALGGVNPQEQMAQQARGAVQGIDTSTYDGLMEGARRLMNVNPALAQRWVQEARKVKESQADVTYKTAQAKKQDADAAKVLAEAERIAREDGLKNLPPEVQAALKLGKMDPSDPAYEYIKKWVESKQDGKGEWSEPFTLDGATVQRNSKTGEIKTAVTRAPVTRVTIPKEPKASTPLGQLKSDLDNGFITKEQYDAAVAKATAIGGKATVDDQRQIIKTLKSAGYDPETGGDAITELIKKSTSGGLEQMGVATAGFFGQSTEGSKAINALAAASNTIVMDLMGGKLGAGVSNADRDFIVGQLGDVANPKKPIDDRLAAWNFAKARMVNNGLLPESKSGPASPNGPIYAVNPSTKVRIMSTDGGKTWRPVGVK